MFNPYPNMYGNFTNRMFSEIFPDSETFKNEYESSKLYTDYNKIENIEVVYYLLYSRYGNSTIASYDEEQFKYKVFANIFMYGPTWEARLKVQSKIRALSDEEIQKGSYAINNMSFNPSNPPLNDSMTPLQTINQQNFNGWKKAPLEGYNSLISLLDTDVTESFIGTFKKLFLKVVEPNIPLYYITDEGEPNI